MGFWASKTLLSAVEIGIFTELAKRAEELATLQGRLGIHPRAGRDFFDALVFEALYADLARLTFLAAMTGISRGANQLMS